MGMTLLIVVAVIAGVVVWVVSAYNRLVRLRNMKEEGWSGIEVQLKRRANLIPNLIETVKGYMGHEKGVLDEVTRLRGEALSASSVGERGRAEAALGRALGGLLALAENYPQLRASENFSQLQQQLAQLEDEIQMARRYYNGTVRNYNVAVESFPSSLVASGFNFTRSEFFEIEDEADRQVPRVSF